MQQKVDLSRLQELSASLDRISRNLEREAYGIERGITNILSAARDAYQPEWYVGQSAGKAEALLREVLSQTKIILDELNRQSAAVRETAEQYGYTESKMKALLNAKFMRKFPAVQKIGGLGARLWDMWRRRLEQGGERLLELLSGKPSLKDLLKAAVTSVQDLQLETRLIPYSSEPRITELLDKLHTGDEALREAARVKLNEIANAFDTLARSQAAYSVYAAYDHKQYMEQVKQTAAAQRDILAGLGVDPAWYGPEISLRKHYKGPLLSACDYNPLQSDFSPMPKEEELRLVIAIGMTVPAYQDWAIHNYPKIEKAAKKRAAELERQREIRRQLMEEYNQKFDPEDIRAMQEALKKRGMYPGEITGRYNEEFLLAVEKFQVMQGREPDGSFDDTLLALAKSTEEAGWKTPLAVGEGIVVQLGVELWDLTAGVVTLPIAVKQLMDAFLDKKLKLDDL
ncbi:peptidoglycan-binding protein, partial [Paenibacillus sp. CN-4]|uniref:peptidoglycan-binding domain-containing protein n=1 Tax=Paenibacillus nanchangensis TaxID=3348343 RepID=UPI00397E1122